MHSLLLGCDPPIIVERTLYTVSLQHLEISLKMATLQRLNGFLTDRLAAAAIEIFGAVEKTMVEYQEQISDSKQEIRHLRKLLVDLGYKSDGK